MMEVSHAQRLENSTAFLFLFVLLLLTLGEVMNKANGLQMITQPSKTIVSFTGSNQTFVWNFILTEQDKAKELKVTFAHWSYEYNMIEGDHLVTFVRKSAGIETVYKGNLSIARRLHWVGDLTRGLVAFQLTNVQAEDASDYGIRFRVDGFPPDTDESGFTLSVQDPPPIPTGPLEVQDITIEVKEGEDLNITCRTTLDERSSLLWLKDNKPVQKGGDKALFLRNVSRSQAGDYVCVSLSQNGSHSSPVTAIDVLYPPRIRTHDKEVSVELLRGHSLTLQCTASGNPSPVIRWHKQGEERRETNKNSWNSSSLVVTPVNDQDFISYACVATNKIGLDIVTFTLTEKADEPASESMSTTGTQNPGQTRMNAYHHRSLWMYLYITGAVVLLAVSLVVTFVCCQKQRGNPKNCCTLGKERGGAEKIPLGPQAEDIETAASLQA